jgi:hypothetical protein
MKEILSLYNTCVTFSTNRLGVERQQEEIRQRKLTGEKRQKGRVRVHVIASVRVRVRVRACVRSLDG